MEFMSTLTLPLSFAFAVMFCGLTHMFANTNDLLHKLLRRISGYWASFCTSLCAATLAVVAGLFVPFICLNGMLPALKFLILGLLVASAFGVFAHYIGVFSFSTWDYQKIVGRFVVGFGLLTVGMLTAISAVYRQLIEVNVV